MRRFKQVGVTLMLVFAAAQLVRPERVPTPADASHTIPAQMGTQGALAAILDRSCSDCHSNNPSWPWYAEVAPVSWLMVRGATEGRDAVNFSEWTGYPPDVQRTLLAASCQDATRGTMPGPYALLRPATKLSPQDIETICAASRQADASAATAGRR